MNKELLVALLQKDIRELALLTEGFEQLSEFPEAILDLAISKSESLHENLLELKAGTTRSEENDPTEQEIAPFLMKEPKIAEFTTAKQQAAQPDNSRNEEFQEEIEVDEIIDDQQLFTYKKSVSDETKIEIEETISTDHTSISDKHQLENKNFLDERIAGQKIDDIRLAISIGDRFRFQRELFDNNGEQMNRTISALNSMSSYDEALTYLAKKQQWNMEDELVESFLSIIKKRY